MCMLIKYYECCMKNGKYMIMYNVCYKIILNIIINYDFRIKWNMYW